MSSLTDLIFIFRFVPCFILIYYIVPATMRMWVLFFGSFIFYTLGEPRWCLVLLGATIFNYILGKWTSLQRKSFLILAVSFDAGLLMLFKILGLTISIDFLPIGISFYTFKMIAYQADLYTGKIKERPDFVTTASYFYFFPQLLQGPIMRPDKMYSSAIWIDSDVSTRKERIGIYLNNIEDGLKYFIAGMAMKVLIADHLAVLWKDLHTIGYESISTPLAWIGALAYSLDLYFDFWGYSLMAAGLGVALGFPFVKNFNHPYAALGVRDFYRRWHMSLGTWFRDYIYIPLGGNRRGDFRGILNLLLVWLLTGIWHGITPNYIIWGMFLYVLILSEKYIISVNKNLFNIVSRLNVFLMIPISWVIFAISDMERLTVYMTRLFPFFGISGYVNTSDYIKYSTLYWPYIVPGLVLLIPRVFDFCEKKRKHPVAVVVLFVLFWLCIFSIANTAGNPLMYLRF
ncbi:alginate O-acetyltransferase complex protein AlgI [Butyrivibrio fibrisolvens DSM 3071]|uniref:Alginate O-acetyltransferase complex protein AlgI n=1 Tax=Butyrivibrio fibrisolvens DSM 3071 TaxID=1121131 RepID=A0A1M5Z7P0_BUTFI|nr:MBOAT family O-acyltransferase [Butyrivibrio fibrisolvens]SHI20108.1 alginate O-acetyltransferase complex protein AlgI [Butyrivibrio fibrisolvens DSM 3071]